MDNKNIQNTEQSSFQIMSNCRQTAKIAKILGAFALSPKFEDAERYKYLFNFVGIDIPRRRTVTENKLIPLLGDAILELLVQYQNLYRFFPDINSIKDELNFKLIDKISSKSLIYANSRIERNKRQYYLDEFNYPKNGDYYNDYMLKAVYSRLSVRYFVFLDNYKNIDLLPNKKIVSVWNASSYTENAHFQVFSATNSYNIREFLQRRNLLLTCF